MVVWQFSEIWTITAFSRLKYTFVTITSLPLALRRRMPGRISLISILLGGWSLLLGARLKSVQISSPMPRWNSLFIPRYLTLSETFHLRA